MTNYINARAMVLMLDRYTALLLSPETATIGILLDDDSNPYSEVRLYDAQGNNQFYKIEYNSICTKIIDIRPIN